MKPSNSTAFKFPSWIQAEQKHLDAGRSMTMKDKLRWLQDAARVAERLSRGPVRRSSLPARKLAGARDF